MYWLLPRSHAGALTTHERAGVRFSTSKDCTLPHGATARLLLVWMHLEAQHTGCGELPLGRWLEKFAATLGLDPDELAEQTERLCACTVSQEHWTCPVATHATLAGAPAIRLGAPLLEALRAHRLEVSLPCLRELLSMPELLDHYLRKCYTQEYYRLDLTTPSTRAMLHDRPMMHALYLSFSALWAASARRPCSAWHELYQELAEPPSPEPTPRELLEFRDRASAHQLTVFTVETSCRFQEQSARQQALSFGV